MERVAVVCEVTDPAKLAHEHTHEHTHEKALALLHLDTLLTCAPFGFVFLDRDLRFVRINEQLAEMNGMSVAAHLGKTVAEIVPALEATLREVTARILATGQPVLNHEFTGDTPRAPGVTRTWNESWYPARDEHGEIIGFSAVVVDITERKQADAVLRGNAALFSKIIEQAPGGVYVVDAQFRVAQMNAESLPFFASAQPLIGRDFDEALGIVWGPEIGPQIASIFRHTLATGERYVSPRFSERRQDIGVEQAFEWETQRITLPDGQYGVVCYFKDVTEREHAEAARRESDERLRLAIAGSDLGTWHWDICTGELDWSERCMEIFGIPAGTAMNYEKFLGAIHPEDRACVDDAVQHAIQNGSEYRIECRNVWPEGSVHWAVSLGRVYCDAAGKPIRMEGIALDITEHKRAEAVRLETEQQYRALAEASLEIPYRMSADWSTMMALDGCGSFETSARPRGDWAWVDQYLPPGEQARVKRAISDAIACKGLFELEHRFLRADGSTGWTRSRAVPILDENNHLVTWFGAASDITERRRVEEERRLLASIVENSRDFIGIADTHGNPVFGNRAAMELVGLKDLEEVRGSKIIDYFVAQQRQFVEEVVLSTAAKDGRWSGELTMQHFVTGASIPVWYDLFRVDDPVTGQPVNFATVTRDLTEPKHTEEALREKAHFLQRIAEVTPGVLHVYDLAERRAVFINRSISSLLHYSPEEVLAMGENETPSLMHPQDLPRFDGYMARVCALADGEVAQFEFRMRDRGGTWRWFLSHGSVFSRDATGAALQTIGVASEITDRKQAEQALADRTELLNGVLEGTTDVIFVKDKDGRCLMANTACAAAFGLTPNQVVGMTNEDFFPPDEAVAVRQYDEAVMAGGSPIQLEETFLVTGEARVFLTLKAPLRDGSSRVIGILGISRDITERKQIELRLIEATAVAEKANEAKSDFLSNMSHELRTPLNAILGFAQLLESGAPVPTPAQKRNLEQIIKGGWYLLELVNDLLDLAQIESGTLSLTQEPVSLAEVMLECRDMIEPQASERAITITFPSLELPGTVRADRTRLKQVVINLLSNAVKYNRAHGTVTVEFALSAPDVVRVSVRDTGEGLTPEQLAQLFQPFNRLGKEAGPEQGTGIGLVMSRHIIESMGGAIGAQSVVGVGSVFWFELKWTREQ